MKLRRAIANADSARPNLISEEQKVRWIYEVEAEFAELMGKKLPDNRWMESVDDIELLVPFPYDNVYELYLCAMIDNFHQESAAYANDLVVANAALDAAKAYWIRHNRPVCDNTHWKVM